MLGSLVVAALIVLLTISFVTSRIGPGVETREREEEAEELLDLQEERREERQDAREDAQNN
jgi:hypothetical protein